MCVCVCVCVCFFSFYKEKKTKKPTEIGAVFTKTEVNNEGNIDFLQISLLGIQHIYSSEFSVVKAPLKLILILRSLFIKSPPFAQILTLR